MIKNHFQKLSLLDFLLFALVFFLYYYGLGSYGLLNNNEGLYAEIPREMLEKKQYIVPYLNGVPYIEKPPLLYWLIAFIYKIGGICETTARLIPATAGAFLSFGTYIFARRTSSLITARLSLLIISTMVGLIIFSRMVFFDILLTFFLSLSLFSFFTWFQTKNKIAIRFFYFFIALATLTKGLIALVLSTLVILIFLILTKSFKKTLLLEILDGWGMLIFILIFLPWHVVAGLTQKEFFHFYFINEHFLRFLGQRLPKDYYSGAWYYYLVRIFITAFPWSFTLPLVLKKSSHNKSLIVFLWVWILAFLIFFSTSQAKANYYLATIFPPLALLLALKLEDFSQIPYVKKIRIITAVFFAFFLPLTGLIILNWHSFLPENANSFIQQIPITSFWIWLGCSIITLSSLKFFKHLRFWPEYFIAFQMIPFLFITLSMAPKADYLFSARAIMQNSPCKEASLFLYRDFEKISSIRFYADKNLPLIESSSNDLQFGLSTREGSSMNFSANQFQTFLVKQKACVAVFDEQKNNFEKNYPNSHLVDKKGKTSLYLLENNS